MSPSADQLTPDQLVSVVRAFAGGLRGHEAWLNRLNVYPVPDGDTGTNMARTVDAVVEAIDALGEAPATEAVGEAISRGSLMGARGNSGVILSQILRGIAEACAAAPAIDGTVIATALENARDGAYKAVVRPVEGTILTVAAAAAEGAGRARGRALAEVVFSARHSAADALERTPEMLPVLADAGVVDAGGAGFLLFLDALLHVVAGRPMPEAPVVEGPSPAAQAAADEIEGESDLRYEVMFFLEGEDEGIEAFKQRWSEVGDSIAVVGGGGLWNCHIHTDDIGASIEVSLDYGRPKDMRITDLHQQVEEERAQRNEAGDEEEPAPSPDEDATTSVVAVAKGNGLVRILKSLGVAAVVEGGQSMNPSTAELLEAVDSLSAPNVIVLPNNKNIVSVALQINELTEKTVRVVPTTTVCQGLAAMLDFSRDADADSNASAMDAAGGRVQTAEVTRAVRDATSELGPIKEGDYLGLTRDGLRVIERGPVEAAIVLLKQLLDNGGELVTIIEGEDARPGDTDRILDWIRGSFPAVEAEAHQGDQPLYPFLLSVE